MSYQKLKTTETVYWLKIMFSTLPVAVAGDAYGGIRWSDEMWAYGIQLKCESTVVG